MYITKAYPLTWVEVSRVFCPSLPQHRQSHSQKNSHRHDQLRFSSMKSKSIWVSTGPRCLTAETEGLPCMHRVMQMGVVVVINILGSASGFSCCGNLNKCLLKRRMLEGELWTSGLRQTGHHRHHGLGTVRMHTKS